MNLVNGLLDLAKINSRLEESRKVCNVIVLAKEALADLQGRALSKDIALEMAVEGGQTPVRIKCDETLIRQALNNLIDNAIKYSPRNSRIMMTVSIKDDMAEFRIQDNGIGISSTDLPFIFDEFYQVRNDGNREGIGLGLTLVRSIAEAHDGRSGRGFLSLCGNPHREGFRDLPGGPVIACTPITNTIIPRLERTLQ